LPALEAVAQAGEAPRSITGIINGTCNFIFDKLASGVDFESAVKLAQQEGFAEADPTLDLNGTDAAQKLILLVREFFGVDLPLDAVDREGIDQVSAADVSDAGKRGNAYRLVADCHRTASGLSASVRPIEVLGSHRFALTKGADNCLVIEHENGESSVLRGRGAGRYATTESVIADLLDVRQAINNSSSAKFLEVAA
jgi:homoserine dehydrogenase